MSLPVQTGTDIQTIQGDTGSRQIPAFQRGGNLRIAHRAPGLNRRVHPSPGRKQPERPCGGIQILGGHGEGHVQNLIGQMKGS